jgi:putative oxidoreductase
MNLALLVLRLIVGLTFSAHGAQKLFGAFGGPGLAGTERMVEKLRMRPTWLYARLVGTAEFAGGLLLAAGLLTAPAAAAVVAVMTVAVLTVHGRNGFFNSNGGFEFNLALVAAVFALAGIGAGAWSLDAALRIADSGTWWAIGALAVGLIGGAAALFAGRSFPEHAHRGPGVRTPA